MIDFYTWKTPNGMKVAIMLEELNASYHMHSINITKKEQFQPDFLKISPNNKIPAIVDEEGPDQKPISVFESGAIMIYLAEKFKLFIPEKQLLRVKTLEWLMFQMSTVGPMLGQVHHFFNFADEIVPYAQKRYLAEAKRIYGVMDEWLKNNLYFATEYSIADMAIFPWVHVHEKHQIDLSEYQHVKRWHHAVFGRDGVKRGLEIIEKLA